MSARRPRWLVAGFWLAVVLAVAFAANAVWTVLRLDDPGAVPVEPWMTPGLIRHSYGLTPEDLATILEVERDSLQGKTLEAIAKARGVPVQTLVAAVQAALDARGDGP